MSEVDLRAELERLQRSLEEQRTSNELLRRDYLTVADALMRESKGPEELAAEARRLRAMVDERGSAIAGYQRALEERIYLTQNQRDKLAILERIAASLKGLRADCLATYLGGYADGTEIEIFRHGMVTVCNAVDALLAVDAPATNAVVAPAPKDRDCAYNGCIDGADDDSPFCPYHRPSLPEVTHRTCPDCNGTGVRP